MVEEQSRDKSSSSSVPGYVKFFMALAGLSLVAIIVLQALTLSKGLDGEFVPDSALSTSRNVALAQETNKPTMTEGECQVMIEFQGENNFVEGKKEDCGQLKLGTVEDRFNAGCFDTGVPPWHPENNIFVTLPDPEGCDVAVSDTWTIAGWQTTYVQIAPGKKFVPPTPSADEQPVLKILRGSVLDVNVNGVLRDDGRWESYVVTAPNRPISLWLGHNVEEIEAGDEGAALVYFKVPKKILNTPVLSMTMSPATDIAGPFSENLEWVKFGTYYADPFENVEFYNLAGMLLKEHTGERLSFFQWWTMREDEDADGYHNHDGQNANDTFAEIHMAMFAASGVSGMQTTLPQTQNLRFESNPDSIAAEDSHKYNNNDQKEVQLSIPLPPGFAHGPLWSVNPEDGTPTLTCEGGVLYPFHRWLIGSGKGINGYHNPPRYSMWVAFEHPPQYATVPESMLTHWPNAYLQTTIDAEDCPTDTTD